MFAPRLPYRRAGLPLTFGLACVSLLHCVQLEESETATWAAPVLVHDVGQFPEVGVDASGNALAVWWQSDGITSSRHIDGQWSAPVVVDDTGDFREPIELGVAGNGSAHAIWMEEFASATVVTKRLTPGGGGAWSGGGPTVLDERNLVSFDPKIAVRPNGTAVVVWAQEEPGVGRVDIGSRRFTSEGWADEPDVLDDISSDATSPRVAVDANGGAMAVWSQADGSVIAVWFNRYDAIAWEGARRIPNAGGNATHPGVGTDGDGSAIAVWQQANGGQMNIVASRWTVEQGWDSASMQLNDDGDATDPIIAVATDGSAIAVWSEDDGSASELWAKRYTPSTGWQPTAQQIGRNDSGPTDDPQLAIDSEGNAVVVWRQPGEGVWANVFAAGRGWSAPGRIDDQGRTNNLHARVAINASGMAIAIWYVPAGTNQGIWSSMLQVN